MSSAPFLKLTVTASVIAPEARTTPHAGRDLDKDEAGALLAFLERVGQAQIDQVAETPLEAHLMYEALAKVRWIVVAGQRNVEPAPSLDGGEETTQLQSKNQ